MTKFVNEGQCVIIGNSGGKKGKISFSWTAMSKELFRVQYGRQIFDATEKLSSLHGNPSYDGILWKPSYPALLAEDSRKTYILSMFHLLWRHKCPKMLKKRVSNPVCLVIPLGQRLEEAAGRRSCETMFFFARKRCYYCLLSFITRISHIPRKINIFLRSIIYVLTRINSQEEAVLRTATVFTGRMFQL